MADGGWVAMVLDGSGHLCDFWNGASHTWIHSQDDGSNDLILIGSC